MKIAVVTNLPAHYRRPLFERLAQRHDATFFFTGDGASSYWSADHELTVGELNTRPARSRIRLFVDLAFGRYDCVLLSLTGRMRLFLAIAAARLSRTPFVLWVGIWSHPTTTFHRVSRRFVAQLYRAASALAVYGPHVAEHVWREAGRTNGVFEVPQSVDNDIFRTAPARSSRSNGVFVALYVGRLEEGKGLETLIQAVATVDGLRLLIAGSGSMRSSLERLAQRLGVSERIAFSGYVSQADLPEFFSTADCLVLPSETTPSFRETWGLVVNEAMNVGLAVVATDAVGAVAGGLVQDGVTGLVVPEQAPKELSAALRVLVEDRDLCSRLGGAGRARVAYWNYDAAVDRLDAAITAAVEHGVA